MRSKAAAVSFTLAVILILSFTPILQPFLSFTDSFLPQYFLLPIISLIGLSLSVYAFIKIRKTPELKGRNLATISIALNGLYILYFIILLLFFPFG
ncbi:hypothetical protein J4408_03740 [Candidatus Pacearchaeota archaeon]|nr:hypothetical protein [Candidatus Pacearchaeota archaeon]